MHIEESASAVGSIAGVPTSITAFVGRAWRGPLDEPIKVDSYADYDRVFGGLWRQSPMSYAVQQFFANGGSQALVVRVATRSGRTAAKAASLSLTGGVKFAAANVGSWGMNLQMTIDDKTKDPSDTRLFNLTVFDDPQTTDDSARRGGSGARETFLNVSVDAKSPRFVTKVLEQHSNSSRACCEWIPASARMRRRRRPRARPPAPARTANQSAQPRSSATGMMPTRPECTRSGKPRFSTSCVSLLTRSRPPTTESARHGRPPPASAKTGGPC